MCASSAFENIESRWIVLVRGMILKHLGVTYYSIKLYCITVLSPHNEAVGADLICKQIEEQEARYIGRSMHCFFIAVPESVSERQ